MPSGRGSGFDPHKSHRVLSLRKTHLLPRVLVNAQEAVAPCRHNLTIVEWDVKPQYKQTKTYVNMKETTYAGKLKIDVHRSANMIKVSNNQERAQSERNYHSKTRGGEK